MTTKTKQTGTSTLGKYYRVMPGYALHMGAEEIPREHRIWATVGQVVHISHPMFEALLALQPHKVVEVTDKESKDKAIGLSTWQTMRIADHDGVKKPTAEESAAEPAKGSLPSLSDKAGSRTTGAKKGDY